MTLTFRLKVEVVKYKENKILTILIYEFIGNYEEEIFFI